VKTTQTGQVKQPSFAAPPAKKSKAILWLSLILLLSGVGAAGVWWWFAYYMPADSNQPAQTASVAQAGDIIPAEAAMVLGYTLNNAGQRSQLQDLWAGSFNEETPATDLLAGNPYILLQDSGVNEFYYVLLKDDPRPYLVIPQGPTISQLLAQESHLQSAEKDNWLIVHPLSTDPYLSALSVGSFGVSFPIDPKDAVSPMQWYITPSLVQLLHDRPDQADSFAGIAGGRAMSGQLSTGSTTLLFNASGIAAAIPAGASENQPALLDLVPSDISFGWIGKSLATDLSAWKPVTASLIDDDVLAKPAVSQLISQLNSEYIIYRRSGADGVEDHGIIIALPPELQRVVSIGDPGIESALQMVAPLVIGRPLTTELAYGDAAYNDIPLRYVNLAGANQALDYAVTDKYIVAATSKEGMFALLDVLAGKAASVAVSPDWEDLLAHGLVNDSNDNTALGFIKQPFVLGFLPLATAQSSPYVISIKSVDSVKDIRGGIGITASQSEVSATPEAGRGTAP